MSLIGLLLESENQGSSSRRDFVHKVLSGARNDLAGYLGTKALVGAGMLNLAFSSMPSEKQSMKNPVAFDGPAYKTLEFFAQTEFFQMIANEREEIIALSEIAQIPKEAIVGALVVEDYRLFAGRKGYDSKAQLRQFLSDPILKAGGHRPNPKPGKSSYMTCHPVAITGAKDYFRNQKNVSPKMKAIVEEQFDFDNPKLTEVVLTLAAHVDFWKKSGFDLFTYNFKTAETLGERAGVLTTLNNIYHYRQRSFEKDDEIFPPGFYSFSNKSYFSVTSKDIKRCLPHSAPALGGHVLDVGRKINFGEVTKLFIDSGLAFDFFHPIPEFVIPRTEWGARPINPNISRYVNYGFDIPDYDTVVFHTSNMGQKSGNAAIKQIQSKHMDEFGWSDIGYNFLIDAKGNIYEGRALKYIPSHAGMTIEAESNISLDPDFGAIGINFLGNANTNLTTEQISSGIKLVEALKHQHPIKKFYGHGELRNKILSEGLTRHPDSYMNIQQCPGAGTIEGMVKIRNVVDSQFNEKSYRALFK